MIIGYFLLKAAATYIGNEGIYVLCLSGGVRKSDPRFVLFLTSGFFGPLIRYGMLKHVQIVQSVKYLAFLGGIDFRNRPVSFIGAIDCQRDHSV